jgi:DNA polymerase-1
MKIAMIRVDQRLRAEGLKARLILQVHDELIVECPAFEAQNVMDIVTREMEQAVALSVPLIAEAKMGESWLDAK